MNVYFKMRVAAHRYGSSSDDIRLAHLIDMPFVPYPDMEVSEGDWSATVKSLCYRNGLTFAFCEDDREFALSPGRALAEIVQDYIEQGWRKSERILSTPEEDGIQ